MKVRLPKGFFPDKQYVFLTAIDPGQSVGVATVSLLRCGNKALKGSPYTWDAQFDTQVLRWPDDVLILRDSILPAADVVVVEDWKLRKDTALSMVGQRLWGPEVMGFVIGHLAYRDSLGVLEYQSPADKEGLDDYIRARVDWPTSEHERDALRHLVRFLLRSKDFYRNAVRDALNQLKKGG